MKDRIQLGLILLFLSISSLAFSGTKLRSLLSLSHDQVKDLTVAASGMAVPKILQHINGLTPGQFDLGVDHSIFHVDRFYEISGLNRTGYAPSISLKAALSRWIRLDTSVMLAATQFYNLGFGSYLKLFDEENFYFSGAWRSIWSYLKLDTYSSHTFENDLVLSRELRDLSHALGAKNFPLYLYVGTGLISTWASIKKGVNLRAGGDRNFYVVSPKAFVGLSKRITKRLDSAFEITYMQDAQIYTVKLSVLF